MSSYIQFFLQFIKTHLYLFICALSFVQNTKSSACISSLKCFKFNFVYSFSYIFVIYYLNKSAGSIIRTTVSLPPTPTFDFVQTLNFLSPFYNSYNLQFVADQHFCNFFYRPIYTSHVSCSTRRSHHRQNVARWPESE